MTRLSASELREDLANALNRVAFGGERIVLHRRGKEIAAIISVEDLAVLQEIEDRMDLEEAKKALARGKFISWKQAEKDLGICDL